MNRPVCETAKRLARANKIVVKIGSSLITEKGRIAPKKLKRFVDFSCRLLKEGKQVILVSSGAIASATHWGLERDKKKTKPLVAKVSDLITRQALASIGQVSLMEIYRGAFAKRGFVVGQILFSKYSIQDRKAYLNARNTITKLLSMGAVPIINENDPLATDEIRLGDNDVLGAYTCGLVEADLYLIFSDVDGFYLMDPDPKKSKRLDVVEKITPKITQSALGSSSPEGTGGMTTKMQAIKLNYQLSIATFLTSGRSKNLFKNVFELGEGTLFLPPQSAHGKKITGKKRWLSAQSSAKGTIYVDLGASDALKLNKSLLAKGIVKVKGHFHTGDIVDIVELDKKSKTIVAKGLTQFDYKEITQLVGRDSKDFEKILGYKTHQEIVHRDNMVLVLN